VKGGDAASGQHPAMYLDQRRLLPSLEATGGYDQGMHASYDPEADAAYVQIRAPLGRPDGISIGISTRVASDRSSTPLARTPALMADFHPWRRWS